MKEWIQNLGPHIEHMHLHNNHGEKDEHLSLENGTIKLEELFLWVKQFTQCESFTIENAEEREIRLSLNALENYI